MILPKKIFANANIDPKLCLFCHPNEGITLYETTNFIVLLCNFPASKGHLMLSSKVHYGSMGELEVDWFSELANLKRRLSSWYIEQGHCALFYEHGRAGSCHANTNIGIQCEHFHLNILASNTCIHDKLQEHYGSGISINHIHEISELFSEWGEYLFFENSFGEAKYYPVENKKVPSHLLRTLLCNKMQCPSRADWEKHQVYAEFLENFHFTQNLSCYLKEQDAVL